MCAGDALAYCNSYPDLKNAYCGGNLCTTAEQEARCARHFGHGVTEMYSGARGPPSCPSNMCDGDALLYCNSYTDLQDAFCGGSACLTAEQGALCANHFNGVGQGQITAGTRARPSCLPLCIEEERWWGAFGGCERFGDDDSCETYTGNGPTSRGLGHVTADQACPKCGKCVSLLTNSPTSQPTAATLEPTEATAEPTEATVEPTAATVEPTESTVEPTEATVEPTEATAEPSALTVEPTEATSEPTEATAEPTEATSEPTEATVEPTEATSEPTASTAEPTEATVEPTDATAEPSAATVEPTEATSEPTDATLEPTEATREPTFPTKEKSLTQEPTAAVTMEPSAGTRKPTESTVEPSSAPSESSTQLGGGTYSQEGPANVESSTSIFARPVTYLGLATFGGLFVSCGVLFLVYRKEFVEDSDDKLASEGDAENPAQASELRL